MCVSTTHSDAACLYAARGPHAAKLLRVDPSLQQKLGAEHRHVGEVEGRIELVDVHTVHLEHLSGGGRGIVPTESLKILQCKGRKEELFILYASIMEEFTKVNMLKIKLVCWNIFSAAKEMEKFYNAKETSYKSQSE